jgi:hypothetical protein
MSLDINRDAACSTLRAPAPRARATTGGSPARLSGSTDSILATSSSNRRRPIAVPGRCRMDAAIVRFPGHAAAEAIAVGGAAATFGNPPIAPGASRTAARARRERRRSRSPGRALWREQAVSEGVAVATERPTHATSPVDLFVDLADLVDHPGAQWMLQIENLVERPM